ncbi:hypothetical protein WMY93_020622 [Mugilogobius chulae]|uniref:DNA repair protein XRCC4 n=1 Tax=Mugilogobius chulae TaxID=88201 RepID=A0AAW0N8C3_9GOBI
MHTSVRQIFISGSSYFVRLDWSGPDLGSGFRLLLTDAQEAWRGEVTQAAICEEAKEMEMDNERYVQDIHQALTGAECSTSYSFTLTRSGTCVSLAYEKVQKDISFRLGSVALTALSDPADAVRNILTYNMDKGKSLERHNRKLEEQNQRLKQEHQRIKAQLKLYAKGKEALELELFSRFVHVLNEKKAKIRSLSHTLANCKRNKVHMEKQTKLLMLNTMMKMKDETKECTTPNPLEDSLSDLTDVAPCRKRRFRHLEAPAPRHSHKRRSESPAGLSVEQAPHRRADAGAATSEAEDLFEDF